MCPSAVRLRPGFSRRASGSRFGARSGRRHGSDGHRSCPGEAWRSVACGSAGCGWCATGGEPRHTATGIRLSELAGLHCGDLGLWQRELTIHGKGGKDRIVKIGHQAARSLDRYLRARSRHAHARRVQLWLGVNNREPLTAAGIYQMITRRGRQAGVDAFPHRFRHHFSHTWLDRGGPEGDLMELNGWSSPQMLRRYGASARSARARRTYDRIMTDT